MTQQTTLWNAAGLPVVNTRAEAAKAIARAEPTIRARVLSYIKSCGDVGCTDEEICIALRLRENTARPRRVALVAEGHVQATGRTRVGSSGRRATVWHCVTRTLD